MLSLSQRSVTLARARFWMTKHSIDRPPAWKACQRDERRAHYFIALARSVFRRLTMSLLSSRRPAESMALS